MCIGITKNFGVRIKDYTANILRTVCSVGTWARARLWNSGHSQSLGLPGEATMVSTQGNPNPETSPTPQTRP